MTELCQWCEESLEGGRIAPSVIYTADGPRHQHVECAIREVMGGIGHLVAHEWWCQEKHDPDAGLTSRQSALLAYQYWLIVSKTASDEWW